MIYLIISILLFAVTSAIIGFVFHFFMKKVGKAIDEAWSSINKQQMKGN